MERPFIGFGAKGRIGGWFCFGVSLLIAAGLSIANAEIPKSSRPDEAQVYFIAPQDGETVSSPLVIRFGLAGMGVAPAGIAKQDTGHHHLIIDAELPPSNLPVPASDHYRHFGKGQTEVTLELSAGPHTLQLLLGDHLHIPHDPPLASERISITVGD